MSPKVGFKKRNTDPCLLYRLNELWNVIFIVYVYGTMKIGDKPGFVDAIECTKKWYVTWSMGELEEFLEFTIKRDLTKTAIKISQPDLTTNMTQGFHEDVKSLMDLNTPAT